MSEIHKVVMSEYIRGVVRIDRTYHLTDDEVAELVARKDDMAYFLDAESGFIAAAEATEVEDLDDNIQTNVVIDGRQVY